MTFSDDSGSLVGAPISWRRGRCNYGWNQNCEEHQAVAYKQKQTLQKLLEINIHVSSHGGQGTENSQTTIKIQIIQLQDAAILELASGPVTFEVIHCGRLCFPFDPTRTYLAEGFF